jgi:hypothetical protein
MSILFYIEMNLKWVVRVDDYLGSKIARSLVYGSWTTYVWCTHNIGYSSLWKRISIDLWM